MDLDEMLRVDRCPDMDELINFEPDPDYSPDAGTELFSSISEALLGGIYVGKIPRRPIRKLTYWRPAAAARRGFIHRAVRHPK